MKLLYLWVRNYKNINNIGFNLSSRVVFETTVESEDSYGNLLINLEAIENNKKVSLFPSNIIDIKAIIGENGAGKTNLIFSLLEILLDKRNRLNGFLVTTESIIVRDKINFAKAPSDLLGKKIRYIYPEDIYNFDQNPFKKFVTRENVFNNYKNNLMETFFENEFIIYYSPFINIDNVHNIDGIENDYSRYENSKTNFINISTESVLISDYQGINNNDRYLITGESELLAYKYEESKRMLHFLKIVNDFNFDVKFHIDSIGVEFTGFGEKFWKSIDKIISDNSSSYQQTIEGLLKYESQIAKTKEEGFFKQLLKSITYCFLSFELKQYFNFSKEEQYPIERLIKNLEKNYNADLENFNPLITYIKNTELYDKDNVYIIDQLRKIEEYFTEKFSSKEIICDGIYGFIIPKSSINDVIDDFLKPPLSYIKINEDAYLMINVFGFNFNGLSSGERGFLSLFSRINFYKNKYIPVNKNILFTIDEGEIGFHPQWQKKYLKILLDFFEKFFPDNRIQLIINTHSPFIVSDLPKENIIFLKKNIDNKTQISDLDSHNLTFGANIHEILANNFFLQDGMIGEFSKGKIQDLALYLTYNENLPESETNVKHAGAWNKESAFGLIEIIGEPVIKDRLQSLFDRKFLTSEKESLELRIKELQQKLNELNEKDIN